MKFKIKDCKEEELVELSLTASGDGGVILEANKGKPSHTYVVGILPDGTLTRYAGPRGFAVDGSNRIKLKE